MDPDPENLDDASTWHQPMPATGPAPEPGRPHDRATIADSDATGAGPETADPASTEAFRTTPDGQATMASPDSIGRSSSSSSESGTGPAHTQPIYRETSGDWDALPPPTFEPGYVVFDKYRLVDKIGEGGMGEVWRVWHLNLEAERALKLIRSELAHNEKGWRRFQREARLMAKINHPAAVAVYDFRRVHSVAYIEMELIRGRSLTDVLKDQGDRPMPLDWTARVLEQLCAVLHEAHGHVDESNGRARPIIHRDLKPSNLMLVERKDDAGPPRIKVLDFGIAKIVEEDAGAELTAAGDLVGTPAYMSPEQIRGGFEKDQKALEIDGRSDLYSTGVVLYHLLTGTLPFRGGRMALLAAHLNSSPMRMKEANPDCDVPEAVERLVLQCLEKEPSNRPQTARELSERFFHAAGLAGVEMVSFATLPVAAPIPATEHDPSAGTLPLAAPARAPAPATSPAFSRPSRAIPMATAAAALVAIVGLGAALIARDRGKPNLAAANGPPAKPTPDSPPTPTQAGIAATAAPALWAPKGYEAVDPNDIVPDHAGFPMGLRRSDNRATFTFFDDRVYLPIGYEPESPNDLIGDPGWPRALIRRKDRARFVYIPGAAYRRGDPRPGAPAVDAEGKPLRSHYIRVPGFYIQDSEVTNGEMSAYAKEHPEDGDALASWKEWLDGFRKLEHPNPDPYPAACVSYPMARKYARWVNGLIPTEAEWEWAAKSQNNEFAYVWGADMTPKNRPQRARLNDPNDAVFEPAPVKKYPDDQTNDHVFDMVGNLRELCADPYIPYTSLRLAGNSMSNPLIDARRPLDTNDQAIKAVVRGGSFQYGESKATAYYRAREAPLSIPDDVGFRVVIECPPSGEASSL